MSPKMHSGRLPPEENQRCVDGPVTWISWGLHTASRADWKRETLSEGPSQEASCLKIWHGIKTTGKRCNFLILKQSHHTAVGVSAVTLQERKNHIWIYTQPFLRRDSYEFQKTTYWISNLVQGSFLLWTPLCQCTKEKLLQEKKRQLISYHVRRNKIK